MTSATKMIIITSNEDLVRQISLNKTNNTLIIDLDNEKEITSTTKNNNNNNITDLALLAELCERNSTSDQIYKRVLDSDDNNRPKSIKVSKTSTDLICNICGDRAIGFNYDALSCASCKAFFRRNANQFPEKLTCLTGKRQCLITYDMRRKCQQCRLDRCFAVGMRKDFILSEQEKEKRRKRLQKNRNTSSTSILTSQPTNPLPLASSISKLETNLQSFDEIDNLLMDMDNNTDNIIINENVTPNHIETKSSAILSLQDRIKIRSVVSSFLLLFQNQEIPCSSIDLSDRSTAFLSWSKVANEIALCFISFFRQIEEFENLHGDDRFILIKYNLLPLFPIFRCFKFKPINNCLSDEDNDKNQKRCQYFMLCDESNVIRNMFANLVLVLVEITKQDSTLLSLLLSILIFSQGLSMNENEPPLKDSLAVTRGQFYYTELLWQYCLDKWDEIQTYKYFTKLITIILRIQSTAKNCREFFRVQLMKSNDIENVAPLMQSVLHIS